MPPLRAHIVLAEVVTASLLAGLTVAVSTGATASDLIAETASDSFSSGWGEP
jgi:hypothetical protein